MNEFTTWDFLKLRAQLAGMKVNDNGASVEFRPRQTDEIGIFVKVNQQDAARDWLKQHGVNLPGM